MILGVRSNNVAEPDAGVPDLAFQAAWLRYSNRFVANFKISAYANVLVANNRLNDAITDSYEQPGYTVRARMETRSSPMPKGGRFLLTMPITMALWSIAQNRVASSTPTIPPLAGEIRTLASAGGQGNVIQGNQAEGSGSIRYSCHVNVRNNPGFELEPCSD